jgi:hypothetical protein
MAHDKAHLVIPLLADKGLVAEVPENRKCFCLMASGGFSLTIDESARLSPRFVLGLLNSSLLFWHLRMISNRFRGGWITCTKQYVGRLPIRQINLDGRTDASHHTRMLELVGSMLQLHTDLASAKTPREKNALQRQIDATDKQIDQLVYELYGLSDDEIKIVEEAMRG